MIGVLIFNIVAVFFAWLESSGRYKHGLKISVFIVFLFLALRYDYGNDYMNYLSKFIEISKQDSVHISFFSTTGYEFGWVYLNRLFGSFGATGFFAMNALLALFSCFVLYRFIKKYVPQKYFWFSVFLYTFQPYTMLVLSSAMRQAVSVSIFLLAVDFIIQKKVLYYIILILSASIFHRSAVFMLPLVLLCFFNGEIKPLYISIAFVVFIALTLLDNEVFNYINSGTIKYFEQYTGYTGKADTENTVGLGFLLSTLIFIVVLYYSQNQTDYEGNTLFKLAILSFLFTPLSIRVQMVGRISYYLLPILMAVFPLVFLKIKKGELKLLFISIIVLFTLYQFYIFFNSEPWSKYFGEYNTIFSAPAFN